MTQQYKKTKKCSLKRENVFLIFKEFKYRKNINLALFF